MEEANLIEEVHEISGVPRWQMKCYQPEVYFAGKIKDKYKEEFVEVITLSLTESATFLVTIGGVNVMPLLIPMLQEVV